MVEEKLIHTNIEEDNYPLISSGRFLPTWDSTDHFNFICAECNSPAEILDVKYYPYSSAIHFYLNCPNGHQTGQRKIYVDNRDSGWRYHKGLDLHKREIVQFGYQKDEIKLENFEFLENNE